MKAQSSRLKPEWTVNHVQLVSQTNVLRNTCLDGLLSAAHLSTGPFGFHFPWSDRATPFDLSYCWPRFLLIVQFSLIIGLFSCLPTQLSLAKCLFECELSWSWSRRPLSPLPRPDNTGHIRLVICRGIFSLLSAPFSSPSWHGGRLFTYWSANIHNNT